MDEKSELVKENRWKTFHTELLEQYKLYVETAEKVSEKRQNSNNFYLALNSSLFTLLGYLATVLDGLWIIILPIMGISISFVWRQNINSFSQLNSAKYDVIHKLEEYLPASLFKTEWYEYLKKGDGTKYKNLTLVEAQIPIIFIWLYLILIMFLLYKNNIFLPLQQLIIC